MKKLLSLPPNLVGSFHEITELPKNEWFCTNDPASPRRRTEPPSAVVRSFWKDSHTAACLPLGARSEPSSESALAAGASL